MKVITELTARMIILFDEITNAFMSVPQVNIANYCNFTGIDVSFSSCGQAFTDLMRMFIFAVSYLGGDLLSAFTT
ncbi:MAG: hypothetical protein JSW38_12130 [Dehalococcoidia bacterium]|nr:MAG: hypothetical protein JSW38_12130 [Dehalococcoidia bacterium]